MLNRVQTSSGAAVGLAHRDSNADLEGFGRFDEISANSTLHRVLALQEDNSTPIEMLMTL